MSGDDETSMGTIGADPAPASTREILRPGDVLEGRFELRRALGSGAHGIVFEALDREASGPVALKLLRGLSPTSRLRFKAEFRALTDVSHPNLVTLHELVAHDEVAFFSMELVEGVDFLHWVRRDNHVDEGRLRDVVAQLVRGLFALHGLGKLHRDLKPSNVLVRARDGRVKLVDFGLVQEDRRQHGAIEGTPLYMSPEQAVGAVLQPASDWYALGVMLYEALTGRPPFADLAGLPLLVAKQMRTVRPPRRRPEIPDDLHALCAALLARQPDARPDGDGILRCLGHAPVARPLAGESPFVGRRDQLRRLDTILRKLEHAGRVEVALLEGPAGSGKTALLQHFIRRLHARGGWMVLRARCHERESVPHKGVDALIDELRQRIEPGALGPVAGAASLSALFPVLADVVRAPPGKDAPAHDPVARRQEAVGALRRVLDQIAGGDAIVLAIEDLQWSDHDGARLLQALLRERSACPTLLLGTLRSDAVGRSSALDELLAGLEKLEPTRVDLGALDVEHLAELARSLLGGRADAARIGEAIAVQAAGNPLFALELARAAAAGSTLSERTPRLEHVILRRARDLPLLPRRLLDTVAIAGRPLPLGVAFEAAQQGDAGQDSLALLRARSLLRTQGVRLGDPVEVFHARIGEIVGSAVEGDDARDRHSRLAKALLRREGDPEAIAFHLERSGDRVAAAERYAEAASVARTSLASHRAAGLYASALRLGGGGHPRRSQWLESRADALADAGRGAEAGIAYLDAMRVATSERRLRLQRRAAEQLLRAGHMKDGLPQLGAVLRRVGLRPPGSPLRALAGLALGRLRVRRRGLAFDAKGPERLDARTLDRIDVCWAAATGLVQADVIVGQDFQTRHLLLALDAGEPYRVARALAVEALYAATAGDSGASAVRSLVSDVEAIGARIEEPHTLALSHLASGAGALYRGRFAAALEELTRGEEILRTRCTDVAWELSMARTFRVMTLWYLGRIEELILALEHALGDAAARDDVHTSIMLRLSYGPLAPLVRGDLAAARAELDACHHALPAHLRVPTFRYVAALTATRIERYAGDARAAWNVMDRAHSAVRGSLMLLRPPFRIFYEHDRGTAAITAARVAKGSERRRRLRDADRSVAALHDQGAVWATALGRPIRAARAAATGDTAAAARQLRLSIEDFEALDMALYAAAARRRLAELRSDRAARDAADDEMRRHGVAEPGRMSALLCAPVTGWPGS